jgi:hypothetical protein
MQHLKSVGDSGQRVHGAAGSHAVHRGCVAFWPLQLCPCGLDQSLPRTECFQSSQPVAREPTDIYFRIVVDKLSVWIKLCTG